MSRRDKRKFAIIAASGTQTEFVKMEDIQSLLERINREGVEKAEAEAARIVAAAKEKADATVREAREEAGRAKAEAEKAADAFAQHASETIRQCARDVVLGVKASLTATLEGLLAKDVDAALADGNAAASLVASAIGEMTGPGEITCGPALAQTLKAQAAALGGFSVVMDETAGAGFSVKLDGGRVEHDFTAEAISAELAKRLRPELAKLLG